MVWASKGIARSLQLVQALGKNRDYFARSSKQSNAQRSVLSQSFPEISSFETDLVEED